MTRGELARRDRRVLGLTLREHVGGRWAISLPAYLIGLPLNLLSIGSNSLDARAPLTWLFIGLISYGALGLVLWLGSVTAFRNRRTSPVPVAWTVGWGALAGGVRGAVAGGLAIAAGLAPDSLSLLLTRVVTGAILGAVLVPLGAFVLSVVSSYRTQRRELVTEAVTMRAEELRLTGESEAMRTSLIESVRAEVALASTLPDAQRIRSASHALWADANSDVYPRLRWQSVVWASIAQNPFPTVPVVVVWVLSAWGSLSATIGWPRALLQMAFSVISIAVLFWIGRVWSRRLPAQSLLAFLVVMGVLVVITGPIASAVFDDRAAGSGAGLVIANSVWLPLLTVLVAICITAIRSSESVLASLRASVREAEVDAAAAQVERNRVQREVAQYLHGSVQSRMLAVAARAAQPDLAKGDEHSALADALDAVSAPPSALSLRDAVGAMCSAWTGLMIVDAQFEGDDAELSVDVVNRVREIIEEGLTNAFRHGGASSVEVKIAVGAGEVSVALQDNGKGVSESGRGLGSAVIAAATGGRWSLERAPIGGTVLLARVRIPR